MAPSIVAPASRKTLDASPIYNGVGRGNRLGRTPVGEEGEVIFESYGVVEEDVVEIVDAGRYLVYLYLTLGFPVYRSSACYGLIRTHQRFPRLQLLHGLDKSGGRKYVRGNDDVVVVAIDYRVFFREILRCEVRVYPGQHSLPLATDGKDAHAQIGYRAGECEREEIVADSRDVL